MLSYCFKCKKKTESKNQTVVKTKIYQRTRSYLLRSLGIETPLSKIPLVGPLLP